MNNKKKIRPNFPISDIFLYKFEKLSVNTKTSDITLKKRFLEICNKVKEEEKELSDEFIDNITCVELDVALLRTLKLFLIFNFKNFIGGMGFF